MPLKKETSDLLKELHQLDVDASYAYEQAIKHMKDGRIEAALRRYREDHEKHIHGIEGVLLSHNEEIPERTRDAKGYLIEGMTMLRSVINDRQALKAMKQNEEITNKKYKNAIEALASTDPNINSLIANNYEDEKKHLNFILTELDDYERREETGNTYQQRRDMGGESHDQYHH